MRLILSGDIPITLGDTNKIEEIVTLGNSIKLWDMNFPERTEIPSEEELTGTNFLSYTDSQKKFMELYYKGLSLSKEREIPSNIRISKLINVLKVLKNHKSNLEVPAGVIIRNNKRKYIKASDCESKKLEDFLNENFESPEIEKILIELEDMDITGADSKREVYHRGEKYDIGEEIAFARGMLFTSNHIYLATNRQNIFSKYNAHELIKLGILDTQKYEKGIQEIFGVEQFVDHKGFIQSNNTKIIPKEGIPNFGIIEELDAVSIETGSKYINGRDIDGYDEQGYDEFGFDRHGFNKEKTKHKITGKKYDDKGFMWDKENSKWFNSRTNTEYDLLGFNIDGIDENGFERPTEPKIDEHSPRLWYKKREDGTYEKTGRKVNPETELDAHGFRYENGTILGYYGKTGNESTYKRFWSNGATVSHPESKKDFYSYDDLDIDGYNEYGFKAIQKDGKTLYIHRDTSSDFDKNGMILKKDKEGNIVGTKAHPSIVNTKFIIKNMIENGNTIDEVYQNYAGKAKCSVEEAQKRLGKSVINFVNITRKLPNILDDAYFQKAFCRGNSDIKAKYIHDFFEACPEIKERIIDETQESLRRISILNSKLEEVMKSGQEAIKNQNMQEMVRLNSRYAQIQKQQEDLSRRKQTLKGYTDQDGR